MKGDRGPYMDPDGPTIWVPATVPYREARSVAASGIQEWNQYPKYVGKETADLIGFTRDCRCEEVCELRYNADGDLTQDMTECHVPAWRFEATERARP